MVEEKAPADLVKLRERLKALSADILWIADVRPDVPKDTTETIARSVYTLGKSVDEMIAARTTRAYTQSSPELDTFLEGVVGVVLCDGSESYHHAYARNKDGLHLRMTWQTPRNEMTSVTVGRIDGRPVNVEVRIAIIGGHRIAFCWPCSTVVDHDMVRNFVEVAMPATARDKSGQLNRSSDSGWSQVVPHERTLDPALA